MHILVSNDDGYQSEGIKALADALRPLAHVTVVAPDQERSVSSNSLTVTRPLRVEQVGDAVYTVDGTPTDCVHLAITGILKDNPPDMLVSGINHGANLGDDILYSGTVAAALEGRFQGFPAIAFSNVARRPEHMDASAAVAHALVQKMKNQSLPSKIILNVNIPDQPLAKLGAFECTRLGYRHLAEPAIEGKDPRGKTIYWVGDAGSEADAGEGTDFFAIANNNIAITPLQIDLTNYKAFDCVQDWAQNLSLRT